MPRTNNPDNYPASYSALLMGAYNSAEPIVIPSADKSAAMRTRQRLYAYINALDKQEEAWKVDYALRASRKYRQVAITVVEGTGGLHGVHLQNKNTTDECLAIESVIASLGDSVKPLARTPEEDAALDAAMQEQPEDTPTADPDDGYEDIRTLLQTKPGV